MKLLPKKKAGAEVAMQKKMQIDEGIAIAKKIDALRETLGIEQQNLEQFRLNSKAIVQLEIDTLIQEKEELEKGNKKLREERLEAQAPIDLIEEWSKVRSTEAANVKWHDQLMDFEVRLIAREGSVVADENTIHEREIKLAERERTAQHYFEQAIRDQDQAAEVLDRARNKAQEILSEVELREVSVSQREEDVMLRENSLQRQTQRNAEHEVDLSNRERALKDKYETFIRAQNYIRKT